MGVRKKWSLTNPQWTVEEEELFTRVTYFQAQMIRDSFEERGVGKESDQNLADRLQLPLWLIRMAHRCRLRSLIEAEVPQTELRRVMRNYHSCAESDRGDESQGVPRALRCTVHLPSRVIELMSAD